MRRILLIIIVLLVVIGAGAAAVFSTPKGLATVWPYLPKSMQTRPSFYLRYALRLIQQRSAKGGTVDWPAVVEHANDLAKDATKPADTYPAIRYALEQLKDGASALTPVPTPSDGGPQGVFGFMTLYPDKVVAVVYPESAAAVAGIRAGDQIELVNGAPPVASTEARNRGYFINVPPPSAKLRVRHPGDKDARDVNLTVGGFTPLPALARRIGGDLGYVEIPATNGADQFAERVRESIFQSDAPTVCGWIVDLRFNNGGELGAMLQTLRPMLGEPPLGAFDAADGTRTAWVYPTSGPFALAKPEQELSHPKRRSPCSPAGLRPEQAK